MRMLTYLRHPGDNFVKQLQERMDRVVDSDDGNRLGERHPGRRSQVTAEVMLLVVLLCAQVLRSFRLTDLSRVLAGLDADVAREVGLVGPDGEIVVPSYNSLWRQMTRLIEALREGWTVVEREGQPDERRVRYDMEWLIAAMVKASIPRRERRNIRHLVVDGTGIRSWGDMAVGRHKEAGRRRPAGGVDQRVRGRRRRRRRAAGPGEAAPRR